MKRGKKKFIYKRKGYEGKDNTFYKKKSFRCCFF